MATKGASINDMMRKLDIAMPTPPKSEPRPEPKPRVVFLPAPTPPAAVVPPAPKRADSAVVQVYRGSAATQQKIEKKDTIKPPASL